MNYHWRLEFRFYRFNLHLRRNRRCCTFFITSLGSRKSRKLAKIAKYYGNRDAKRISIFGRKSRQENRRRFWGWREFTYRESLNREGCRRNRRRRGRGMDEGHEFAGPPRFGRGIKLLESFVIPFHYGPINCIIPGLENPAE